MQVILLDLTENDRSTPIVDYESNDSSFSLDNVTSVVNEPPEDLEFTEESSDFAGHDDTIITLSVADSVESDSNVIVIDSLVVKEKRENKESEKKILDKYPLVGRIVNRAVSVNKEGRKEESEDDFFTPDSSQCDGMSSTELVLSNDVESSGDLSFGVIPENDLGDIMEDEDARGGWNVGCKGITLESKENDFVCVDGLKNVQEGPSVKLLLEGKKEEAADTDNLKGGCIGTNTIAPLSDRIVPSLGPITVSDKNRLHLSSDSEPDPFTMVFDQSMRHSSSQHNNSPIELSPVKTRSTVPSSPIMTTRGPNLSSHNLASAGVDAQQSPSQVMIDRNNSPIRNFSPQSKFSSSTQTNFPEYLPSQTQSSQTAGGHFPVQTHLFTPNQQNPSVSEVPQQYQRYYPFIPAPTISPHHFRQQISEPVHGSEMTELPTAQPDTFPLLTNDGRDREIIPSCPMCSLMFTDDHDLSYRTFHANACIDRSMPPRQ